MLTKTTIPLAVTMLLVWFTFLGKAQAQTPSESPIQILEATQNYIRLELTLPEFEIEQLTREGLIYHRLQLPGWGYWGQPGQPQLPMQVVTLGMPQLGQPQIEIIDHEMTTLNGYTIYPNPNWVAGSDGQPIEQFTQDSRTYNRDRFLPDITAKITNIGLIRDQPVFQLRLYPFHYNPSRQELRVYQRLQLQITFPRQGRQTARVPSSPAGETMLQRSLLNYAALSRPIIPPRPTAGDELRPADISAKAKILVDQTGLYRLTYDLLQAQAPGLVVENPHNFELSQQGFAVPMLFEGDADNIFEAGESFLFYGEAIDNHYTRYNVYWLQFNPTGGLRMTVGDGLPNANPSATSFEARQYYEQNKQYWRAPPNGEGKDHWFWNRLTVNSGTPATAIYNFDLQHIAPTGPDGEIRLMLYGSSFGDYQMQLYLNGNPLLAPADQTWSGREERLFVIPVAQNLFVEGSNQLQVDNILPAGRTESEFYINWFEIIYQDTYVAEDDQLRFASPEVWTDTYTISGFSTSNLYLFDITDPFDPITIQGFDVTGGNLRFSFIHPNPTISYQDFIVQRTDQPLTPVVVADEPSSWRSPGHAASYVIITHPQFYEAIQPLASYRQSQGETVVVVKTDDLYDEFNDGIYDPRAIRDFLAYAYANWSTPPTYVLLVGDASVDPKNYRGNSLSDLLPAYYVNAPLFGQAPSDRWYTTISGADEYPDIIIGRLPARTINDITAMTTKIQTYEQNPPSGGWTRRALLIAHDETPQFEADMERVAALLPSSIDLTKVYGRTYNGLPAEDQVKNDLDEGVLILAYSGHGHELVWGKGYQIFHRNQIYDLSNGYKTPFMTAANCLTGYFAGYGADSAIPFQAPPSMSELFLFRKDGGGIAAWAPSSYGFPTPNHTILTKFYESLIVDNEFQPGVAATTAQIKAYDEDDSLLVFFETFQYLGDPAIKLDVPIALDLAGRLPVENAYMGQPVVYELTYAVSGAGQANNLTLVNTLPTGLTYVSASPAPSTIYGNTLTWNFGNVPASNQLITLQATVNQTGLTHNQIITNTARLFDDNGGDQIVALPLTVLENPISVLTATHDGPTLLGQPTNFVAAVTGGNNVGFTWELGAGQTQNGASITHQFTETGRYPVTVIAQNSVSQQSQLLQVDVLTTPVASFTVSSPVDVGQTVIFSNHSQVGHAPEWVTYEWDFGDGEGSTRQQPTHVYTIAGSYPLTLTVSNRVASDTITGSITVLDVDEPIAGLTITHDGPMMLGQITHFTATILEGHNGNYSWDFGDGSSLSYQCCQRMQVTNEHLYTATGRYTVQVVVTNSINSQTQSIPITITDVQPIADFVTSAPDLINELTSFTSRSQGTNLTYHWNFGDGSSVVTSQQLTVTHSYTTEGFYTVILTASNPAGSHSISQTVEIVRQIQKPIASFNSNSPISLGQTMIFTNTSQDGGDRPENITYQWALGDGEVSTLVQPIHRYATIGTYQVILTVTNSFSTATVSQLVTVTDVPLQEPQISYTAPTIVGYTTSLTAMLTAGTNVHFAWDLGDGTLTTGQTVTHRYTAAGNYLVVLTLSNSLGSQVITEEINIIDAPIDKVTLQHNGPTQLSQPTRFTVTTTSGTSISYLWDFGDGQTLVTQTPVVSHLYHTADDFVVRLTAHNSQGSQQITTTVQVLTCEPIQDLQIRHPNPALVNQPTPFTASLLAGSEVTYQWHFDDTDQTPSAPVVSHTYLKTGEYRTTLTATNCWGQVVTRTQVSVRDVPLEQLSLTSNSPTIFGQPTVLTATVMAGTNVEYRWDLGDNSVPQSGAVIHYTYPAIGSYEITVTVSNGSNLLSETLTIRIVNPSIFLPLIQR